MKYILAVICLTFFSCGQQHNLPEEKTVSNEAFRTFLQKFKPIELPFVFRTTSSDSSTYNTSGLVPLSSETSDTLYIKTDDMNSGFCFGYLTDTSKFYSLIYLLPSDNYYPYLATYTKSGKLISKESLLAAGYGMDCGLKFFSINCLIDKDYSVFSSDTCNWEFFCDSLGKPKPNSAAVWNDMMKANVNDQGVITVIDRESSKKNL